jgi:hypothetical protein
MARNAEISRTATVAAPSHGALLSRLGLIRSDDMRAGSAPPCRHLPLTLLREVLIATGGRGFLVGARGFEPLTSSVSGKGRATL